MRYQCALLAVKDVKKSRAFYEKWFGLEVEVDLGQNLGFKGGLALQEHFCELLKLPEESLVEKSHNMELYFESEDLDAFDAALDASIERVHPIREYPWHQRVLRIYDLDHHIIEVGESMGMVFRRLIAQGHSVEETAQMTQHPVEYVRAVIEERA